MRVLCAISSCESYENSGLNTPARETCLPEAVKLGMEYRFFHGRGALPKDDVVLVDADDAYFDLTSKTKLKLKWALEHDYSYVFCAFPDTYMVPGRLLSSGFENYDYMGNVYQHPGGNKYCQGGPGYMLSRRSAEILVNDPTNYSNEDCWVADVLIKHSIAPTDHPGFTPFGPGPLKSNQSITNHLSTVPGGFTKELMYAEHQNWKDSCAF